MIPMIGDRLEDPIADERQSHQKQNGDPLAHPHVQVKEPYAHISDQCPKGGARDGGKATDHSIETVEFTESRSGCQKKHVGTVRSPYPP